jgi:hypothetical protein
LLANGGYTCIFFTKIITGKSDTLIRLGGKPTHAHSMNRTCPKIKNREAAVENPKSLRNPNA